MEVESQVGDRQNIKREMTQREERARWEDDWGRQERSCKIKDKGEAENGHVYVYMYNGKATPASYTRKGKLFPHKHLPTLLTPDKTQRVSFTSQMILFST